MKNKYTLILRLAFVALVGSLGSAFAQSAASDDSNITPQEIVARQTNLRAYFHEREKNLHIVMTRTMPNGDVVDFVPADPNVVAPPIQPSPLPTTDPSGKPLAHPIQVPVSWLQKNPALQGPAGTGPIGHFDIENYLANVKVPAKDAGHMFTAPRGVHETLNGSSEYYYWVNPGLQSGAAGYPTNTYGAFANINFWDTIGTVNYTDHIISELALTSEWTATGLQTVEMGQIQCPALNNGNDNPCLFVFYTTDNYQSIGNNVGGYNQIQTGYSPFSGATSYVGQQLSPSSVAGGAQTEIQCQIEFQGQDWVLYLAGHAFGYYPRSLFSSGVHGLESGAFSDGAYGEVAESVDPSANGMGSGFFAYSGWSYAAYIRNTGFIYTDFSQWSWGQPDYILPVTPTDSNCYSINGPYFGSGNWINYFFYGGTGSGAGNNACQP